MNWITFGKEKAPTLLLIPGLGVSYEIFLPLVRLLEERPGLRRHEPRPIVG